MVAINRLGWTDGERFRPERWTGKFPHPQDLPSGWSHMLAFGDGPKGCAGVRFGTFLFSTPSRAEADLSRVLAIFEMKALLTTLIRTFSFYDTGVELDFKVSVSMQAFVRGKLEEGPQVPLGVRLL